MSPSISSADERRTSYPFNLNPFVEESFREFAVEIKARNCSKYLTRDHNATRTGMHPIE
jgi:hypothetical protein